ncbi:MAG: hypothetical protein J6W75_10405 [Bacteroidaceae bacterium]|nr:hypothetical protein [Bacteroidaceae bacterium]
MKKTIIFFVLAVMMMVGKTFAQSTAVANLYHEGAVTHFYGATALSAAHNAAVNGDTITLSSGDFLAHDLTITKAITIIGAGMNADSNGMVTYLRNNITINISEAAGHDLKIEGIYNNSKLTVTKTTTNSTISKSRLLQVENNDKMIYVHCKIAQLIGGDGRKELYNCFLIDNGSETANFYAVHCIIYSTFPGFLINSTFQDCIFYRHDDAQYVYDDMSFLPLTTTANNCCSINNIYIFDNIQGNNRDNEIGLTFVSFFKNFSGSYDDNLTFELTNEAATTYLGADGTQVGIYGGTIPFDPTPSNPQITKFNVASKAVNGKVSVQVEVNGGE